MKTKVLRRVRLFFRGMTVRTRVALLVILSSALVLAGFGVYALLRDDTTESSVRALFPEVARDGISTVLCHTVSGAEFTVKGATYTQADEYGNPKTLRRLYLADFQGDRSGLTLEATALSSFVVNAGKNYIYKEVIRRPEEGSENYAEALAAYLSKKAELGFDENSAYYVLTTTDGTSYRVNYGKKDITGDGYYVQLAGEEIIYATRNAFLGDLLQEDGPESLIAPTVLLPSSAQYAYALPGKFSLYDYRRITTVGTVISEDAYGVGYTLLDQNGKAETGSFSFQSFDGESAPGKYRREQFTAFFTGKALGECNELLTFAYPSTEDMLYTYQDADGKTQSIDYRGKTESYQLRSIDYITEQTLRFSLKYLFSQEDSDGLATLVAETNAAYEKAYGVPLGLDFEISNEREVSHSLSPYQFTAPQEITSYIPNADTLMTALEKLFGLVKEGKVVKLGLSDAVLTEYGLYRHQIRVSYPMEDGFGFYVREGELKIGNTLYNGYAEGWLYVSDVNQETNTRYVGSMLYDLVIEVPADSLSFMELPFLKLVDDSMITAKLGDVDSFEMIWNFGSAPFMQSAYRFDVKFVYEPVYKLDESGKKVLDEWGEPIVTEYKRTTKIESLTATPIGGGTTVSLDGRTYQQLFSRMAYSDYRGEHGLSDAEVSAILADPAKCVLRLRMTLSDTQENEWEFYPISADRVMIRVKNGKYADYGQSFFIYGTALSDIAKGYTCLMQGEPFDFETRYE